MWKFCFIWICLLQESIILFCILGDKHIKYIIIPRWKLYFVRPWHSELCTIIVWPAYTSLGLGQNFVQKDWVNGLSSQGPDEERIGSTKIIFCHKNKCSSAEEGNGSKCGFKRRSTHCGDCQEDFRGVEWFGRTCGAVHEGWLFQCDVCGKHFRRREYLVEHVVLFRKGVLFQCYVCRNQFSRKECIGEYMVLFM